MIQFRMQTIHIACTNLETCAAVLRLSEPALSALVAPFSSDRAAVLDLTDRCAKAQLPPSQLVDEVQNFLVH